MVKMGYDGMLINFDNGIVHFVAFDPKKLKVIGKTETRWD
jgi:hypothetical protein